MAALVGIAGTVDTAGLRQKEEKLLAILKGMGRVIIAYSGGTDSAYLAWAAVKALGQDAVAITADSASIPESHKRDAEAFARQFGIRHEYIETFEFDNPDYVKNSADRCFHCKDELFNRLDQVGAERGIANIVYGVNKDDLGDYRPGQNAARIHEVKAPLVEANLTKAEIRELSRLSGLPTWDRPASACLSSRVPYGTPVTIETVKTVEKGEEAIKALGFRQFRVRFHGELVRIEVAREELEKALTLEMAQAFAEFLSRWDFTT
jgi:TIGR00268 family protein